MGKTAAGNDALISISGILIPSLTWILDNLTFIFCNLILIFDILI